MKKRETKTKKKSEVAVTLSQHNADIKRYIGAISEDFQHRLSGIGEQFSGLNEKLDKQGRTLDEHTEILGEQTQILMAHTTTLNEHGKKLDSHTEMIGRLMVDVEDIKVNMHEKVNRSEFSKLETRLVSLESFVFSGKQNTAGKKK